MRTTCATWLVACLTVIGCAGAAHADSYSKAVQKSCAADYHKYCGEYGLESAALRVCMDKAGKSLSKACVKALIQSARERHREGASVLEGIHLVASWLAHAPAGQSAGQPAVLDLVVAQRGLQTAEVARIVADAAVEPLVLQDRLFDSLGTMPSPVHQCPPASRGLGPLRRYQPFNSGGMLPSTARSNSVSSSGTGA